MGHTPPGSSVHGILQARITGVVCHVLFQGIFLAQGSNLSLLYLLQWQAGALPLALPGKPMTLYTLKLEIECLAAVLVNIIYLIFLLSRLYCCAWVV